MSLVVDTHCHLGTSGASGFTVTEDEVLAGMGAHGVDVSLVIPHAVSDDPVRAHERVADFAARHPGRIYGVACLSPLGDPDAYRREITRVVKDLRFLGVKMHPFLHTFSPLWRARVWHAFAVCAELEVPIIAHTGLGIPFALPALWMPVARAFPELPIVLAHAGHGMLAPEAVVAAEFCPNVYLEPSWCPVTAVKSMLEVAGAARLMWGSDHPANLPVELAKYRALGLGAEDLGAVLGGTAQRVFGLPR